MKLKKAEAYIDTVVTVFINLIIIYLVLNLFSYMITYQKLNHAADNIIRCAAINGTTDTGVLGEDINEYITNEGFDCSKVTVSFDGTEYMSGSTETVQFGDTILLNIKTNQSFKFIGRTGASIFNISVNKTSLSEKYYQNTNIIVGPTPSDPGTGTERNGTIPSNGIYYKGGELCGYCGYVYGIQDMNHGPMTDASYEFTQSPTATYTSGQSFPETVEVGDIYVEDDFRYSYFSDGWHVSVLENKAQYNGTILSEINGKKVTDMNSTFSGCTALTTAPTIPNSVTDMSYTFTDCTNLTTAPTIPNSVTDMGWTFDGCTSLTTAPAIPSSVTNMGSTFWGCTSLTTAPTIPSSVTGMSRTFQDCTSLATAPTIPSSVTNMDSTFSGCTSLTTVPAIPSSVTDMGWTFDGCTSLTTAPTIPSSVTIMRQTFQGCTSLTGTIEINASPTSYYGCFRNTVKPITLTGSSTKLYELAATANKGNVRVG